MPCLGGCGKDGGSCGCIPTYLGRRRRQRQQAPTLGQSRQPSRSSEMVQTTGLSMTRTEGEPPAPQRGLIGQQSGYAAAATSITHDLQGQGPPNRSAGQQPPCRAGAGESSIPRGKNLVAGGPSSSSIGGTPIARGDPFTWRSGSPKSGEQDTKPGGTGATPGRTGIISGGTSPTSGGTTPTLREQNVLGTGFSPISPSEISIRLAAGNASQTQRAGMGLRSQWSSARPPLGPKGRSTASLPPLGARRPSTASLSPPGAKRASSAPLLALGARGSSAAPGPAMGHPITSPQGLAAPTATCIIPGSGERPITIGVESEFRLGAKEIAQSGGPDSLTSFGADLAERYNKQDRRPRIPMRPTLRRPDEKGNYERWCLVEDGTIFSDCSPCESCPLQM